MSQGPQDPYGRPYGSTPGQHWSTPHAPPTARGRDLERSSPSGAVAVVALAVGTVVALAYAVYAMTARRGIFADLADDPRTVSRSVAEDSDSLNTIFVSVTLVVVLVAVALWIVALAGGRGRTLLGWLGLAAAAFGGLVAAGGGALTGGVESVSEVDDAVTGYTLVAAGMALLAVGLVLGLVALLSSRTGASDGADTRSPYAPPPYQQPPQPQRPPQPQQPPYGQPQQPPYGQPQRPPYGQPQQPPYGQPGQPPYPQGPTGGR